MLEPDLRANGGTEIVAGTTIQEHDFVACFRTDTKPAGIEFNAAAGIENPIRVAINNIANLVIDHAGSHRTTDAKIHKAAFQQSEKRVPGRCFGSSDQRVRGAAAHWSGQCW